MLILEISSRRNEINYQVFFHYNNLHIAKCRLIFFVRKSHCILRLCRHPIHVEDVKLCFSTLINHNNMINE